MQQDVVETVETVCGRAVHLLCRRGTGDLDIFRDVVGSYRLDTLFGRFDRSARLRIVDVGAHIGSFSLLAALHFPHARVEAYEMLPDNAALARGNAERNGVADRLTVHRAVVSDRAGWWDPGPHDPATGHNTGGASVALERFESGESGAGMVRVLPAARIIDGSAIDVLKIDCEGSEYRILFSAADNLDSVAAIIGELHDAGLDRETAGYPWTRDGLLQLLRERGRFDTVETHGRRTQPWGFSELFTAIRGD